MCERTLARSRDAQGNMKDSLSAPWFYKESPEFYGWLRSTYMYHQVRAGGGVGWVQKKVVVVGSSASHPMQNPESAAERDILYSCSWREPSRGRRSEGSGGGAVDTVWLPCGCSNRDG